MEQREGIESEMSPDGHPLSPPEQMSVIGMQELTRRANELVVTEYRPLEIYTILVLEYLVVILIVSAGVRWLERRLDTS